MHLSPSSASQLCAASVSRHPGDLSCFLVVNCGYLVSRLFFLLSELFSCSQFRLSAWVEFHRPLSIGQPHIGRLAGPVSTAIASIAHTASRHLHRGLACTIRGAPGTAQFRTYRHFQKTVNFRTGGSNTADWLPRTRWLPSTKTRKSYALQDAPLDP
jgi:hypothetical protein